MCPTFSDTLWSGKLTANLHICAIKPVIYNAHLLSIGNYYRHIYFLNIEINNLAYFKRKYKLEQQILFYNNHIKFLLNIYQNIVLLLNVSLGLTAITRQIKKEKPCEMGFP